MSAHIRIVRSPEIRGYRVPLDILVDGTVVGTLRRGQELVHEVVPGEHQLQAVWKSDRTSPLQQVAVHDGDSETRYVSFVSERAHYVRSPTEANDWLLLTADGTRNNANGAKKAPCETRLRLALTLLAVVGFVINLVASAGSTLKYVSYIVWMTSGLVAFVLIIRHFRRLYRSPDQGTS